MKRCILCGKQIKDDEIYCKEDKPFAEKVKIVIEQEYGDILKMAENFLK